MPLSSAPSSPPIPRVPGDLLLHPSVFFAALLLLFNDFILKRFWAGQVSGKLSDLAICFLLPLILVALWEWGAWFFLRLQRLFLLLKSPRQGEEDPQRYLWRPASRGIHGLAVFLAGFYFAALQIWPWWGRFHQAWVGAVLGGRAIHLTPDITDLWALWMLPVAWSFLGRRYGAVLQRKAT